MRENYDYSKGSKLLKILILFSVLDLICVVSTGFIYVRDYFANVKKTFDETNKTYTVRSEFIMLYLCISFSMLILIITLIYIIILFIVNYVC